MEGGDSIRLAETKQINLSPFCSIHELCTAVYFVQYNRNKLVTVQI